MSDTDNDEYIYAHRRLSDDPNRLLTSDQFEFGAVRNTDKGEKAETLKENRKHHKEHEHRHLGTRTEISDHSKHKTDHHKYSSENITQKSDRYEVEQSADHSDLTVQRSDPADHIGHRPNHVDKSSHRKNQREQKNLTDVTKGHESGEYVSDKKHTSGSALSPPPESQRYSPSPTYSPKYSKHKYGKSRMNRDKMGATSTGDDSALCQSLSPNHSQIGQLDFR